MERPEVDSQAVLVEQWVEAWVQLVHRLADQVLGRPPVALHFDPRIWMEILLAWRLRELLRPVQVGWVGLQGLKWATVEEE